MLGILLGLLPFIIALYLFLVAPSLRKNETLQKLGRIDIAHRGLFDNEAGVPENSLPAFSKAIEAGVAVEMDVQLTKDKQLVVFHDDNTLRMTGHDGKIGQMTLAELKNLRLLSTEEQIPTFGEFLTLMDGKVPLCIEFKISRSINAARIAEESFKLLDNYKGVYFIESFDPRAVRWVRQNRPGVGRGQLAMTHGSGLWWLDFISSNMLMNFLGRPHFIAYECSKAKKKLSPRLCRKLFRAVPVEWTVRDEKLMEENRKKGIWNIYERP